MEGQEEMEESGGGGGVRQVGGASPVVTTTQQLVFGLQVRGAGVAAQVAPPPGWGWGGAEASAASPTAGWLECSAAVLSTLIGSLRSLKVVIVDTTCGDRLTSWKPRPVLLPHWLHWPLPFPLHCSQCPLTVGG